MLKNSSDHIAILKVNDGHIEYFDVLITKYRDRIYRFIVKKIGDIHEAEDITQDTFVDAFRLLGLLRDPAMFSSWLYGIALNKCKNYLNRSPGKRYNFCSLDKLFQAAGSPSPVEALISKEELEWVSASIDGLPADLREILIMVCMEDISYEEVSVILKIPVGTVRSRLHRARIILKKAYSKKYRT